MYPKFAPATPVSYLYSEYYFLNPNKKDEKQNIGIIYNNVSLWDHGIK